ncbi:MAG: hypothetical protein ACT4OY_07160 [Alphaproteobacteria bacterium]
MRLFKCLAILFRKAAEVLEAYEQPSIPPATPWEINAAASEMLNFFVRLRHSLYENGHRVRTQLFIQEENTNLLEKFKHGSDTAWAIGSTKIHIYNNSALITKTEEGEGLLKNLEQEQKPVFIFGFGGGHNFFTAETAHTPHNRIRVKFTPEGVFLNSRNYDYNQLDIIKADIFSELIQYKGLSFNEAESIKIFKDKHDEKLRASKQSQITDSEGELEPFPKAVNLFPVTDDQSSTHEII